MWSYTALPVLFLSLYTYFSSLWLLTQKPPFLVALAMGRRLGELQALSARIAFQGHDIVLSYLLNFVTETELPIQFHRSLSCLIWVMLLPQMMINSSPVLFGPFGGTCIQHRLHLDPDIFSPWSKTPGSPSLRQLCPSYSCS